MQRGGSNAGVRAGPAGYRKGDEARARILEAGLRAFGAHGFRGATTRGIAEAAEVNLPALKYYFGGKEGLYLACAEAILQRYQAHMLALAEATVTALQGDMSGADARAGLKALIGALAELSVADDAELWIAFFTREMVEPGPAFTLLYEQLWAPGVELVAALVARARGQRVVGSAARIEALLLISSLTAFSVSRPVSLQYLAWPDARDERLAQVRAALEAQIERIG
ncbi:CerR family C-terminal domain-containing protein [Zavarzinia sp. CC-PAN008]|uniref:CerR family C-terminal domain-containing protein n=1 Tax=Zavarzinia sp. CC-PAN008 TaxID=3243332 RepID=UPI003F7456A8